MLRPNEDRFKSQTGDVLILPPLGNPFIEVIRKTDPNEIFALETHVVRGLPPPMHGVLYIVQDHIAKLLYGTRKDVLIVFNKRVESTENPLNLQETMLVGDDFAYFLVESES